MAVPTTALGTKFRVLLGDGGTPTELFTAFCGLTAKSINFQTNTNEFFVPDCDDPDAPAWREIAKSGRFVSIAGEGIMDFGNAFERYMAAYADPDPVNARIEIAIPAVDNGGYWEGAFLLTNFQVTGNDGEKITTSIALESDGAVTWVPAA